MIKALQEMRRDVDGAIHTVQAGTAYDFNGSRGVNLADGIDPQDAVTMNQLAHIDPVQFTPGLPDIGALDLDGDELSIWDTSAGGPRKITPAALGSAILEEYDVERFKGFIDCSGNPNYPAANAGYRYRVTVAGKIGGASGINVEINDWIECCVDGSPAGDHASVGANWGIGQGNIDGPNTGSASVASRNALAAMALPAAAVLVFVDEPGCEGWFKWSASNHINDVAADARQGVFVAPSSDTTGASGAWVRVFEHLYASYFGVQGNSVSVAATVSIASGSAALTAVGAAFTAADVGKRILVPGAGASGATLVTTISAFADATHVTLAANAGTTLSSVAKTVSYATDDLAALNAAISLCSYLGGGEIRCDNLRAPVGISGSLALGNGTSTVRSTINGVFLRGRACASTFSSAVDPSTIKWYGAASTTVNVVHFKGTGQGGGLLGGWVLDGSGLAGRGLALTDWVGAKFPNVRVIACTTVYCLLYTQATANSFGGCRNNEFGIFSTDTVPSGATGLQLDGDNSLSICTLQNTFNVVDMPVSGTNVVGILLGYAGFNEFNLVDIGRQSALSGTVGLKLLGSGPTGGKIYPNLNVFGSLAISGGAAADLTNGTPCGNTVKAFDVVDSEGAVPNIVGLVGVAHQSFGAGFTKTQSFAFGYHSPGWNTVTPSRPGGTGSGNKVTNTNPYPVIIYMSGNVGTVIVDAHGTDPGALLGVNPGTVILEPGGSIYFTTTVATAWVWCGYR
ncbi:hypothetical protein [Hyphomicrobium sp. DY-1]|uniref:hypothetical protein n=1 Tax=Hyphomicrobium sp. DY-1 TaxID=3075650 RepID=UPI0039C43CA5